MATAVHKLSLDDLRRAAKGTPALASYVARFEQMRDSLQERGEHYVLWAVAHGRFVDLIGTGKARSTSREKYLFVTNLPNAYASYEALVDNVLGPIMDKTGRLIDYEAWTLEEFRRIAKGGTSELLQSVLTRGVTLFGSPPYPGADQ